MATSNLGLTTINSSDYVSVAPFNTNWELLDKLGVNYIKEEGDNGNWHYRIWSNGYLEQWGRVTYAAKSGKDDFHQDITFFKAFKSAPYAQVSCSIDGMKDSYVKYCRATTTMLDVYIAKPIDSYAGCQIDIYVAGKTA